MHEKREAARRDQRFSETGARRWLLDDLDAAVLHFCSLVLLERALDFVPGLELHV